MTPQYYIAIVRAAHRVEAAQLHYTAVLLQAGLDPAQSHRFDDAAMTIAPIVPDAPDAGPPPPPRPR